MRYLLDRNFSFFSFFVVISFLFIALLYLPITATAADIFSENSSSKWDTIVDSDGSPAGNTGSNRGTSVDDNRLPTNRKTNHYSPSRLDEKRVQLKAESGNNIKAEKKRAVRKSVTYSGRAEADGRSATLELHFDGNNVSGRLQAKGVSEKYIRLPSTDATFAPIPLNGTWEADDTTIFASWKGGDFIDGVLIPDYPTRGNLSIKLAERDGKKVVYLHRIDSSSTGYVFPLKGVVYTPPDADNSDDPAAGNGYWDPVGSWSGVEFDCPFKTVLEKSGAVTVTITCENDEPEYRKGKWNRQGNGIKVKWSRATMKEHELEKSTFHAFFDGANCLILDGGDDDGARLFRDSSRKKRKPSSSETIDPKKIKSIVLIPGRLRAEPEKPRALPEIYGVHSETGEQLLLKDPDVVWLIGTKASTDGTRLTVRKGVKNGTTFSIQADVLLGYRSYQAKAEIEVVEKLVTGYILGKVKYYYTRTKRPYPEEWPRHPQSAIVSLAGPGGERRQNVGPDGVYHFKDLERGRYKSHLHNVKTGKLPVGWQPSSNQPDIWRFYDIPRIDYQGSENWEVKRRILDWNLKQQLSGGGCVYGLVTYKGKPVDDADVTLVGHMGRQLKKAVTNNYGEYQIKPDELDGGEYTISALKMMGGKDQGYADLNMGGKSRRWASSDDLIGPVEAGREVPKYIGIPLGDPRGVRIDIPCSSRGELFK